MSKGTPARRGRGPSPNSVASRVRARVEASGERYWSLSDFRDLPAMAAMHALSRLAAEGELQRVRKGQYFRPKPTVLGPSIASASAMIPRTINMPLHPAGMSAAGSLGLTTQNPARPEFATPAASAPSALPNATVRTRRPVARQTLNAEEAALLELLRDGARFSDLPAEETAKRLVTVVADTARFNQLAGAALSEPPRVRAMLGALGEQAGAPRGSVEALRKSLNPISKFDFGLLSSMPNAKGWQAR